MKKRGFVFATAIIVLVLIIIALGLGFIFFDDIIQALGSKYFLIGIVVIIVIIFHKVVESILLTLWGWVKAHL